MGWELWTSPQTGYRRRGTRFAELRSLFEEGISARAILEPLLSCPARAPAAEMAQHLEARDFDVAGVQLEQEGPVVGYVNRRDLEGGDVKDYLREFKPDDLVADSVPLAGIFGVLEDRNHVFVLAGSSVSAIVTRADLNKPPARIYLFGLVSLLEMHLTFWISQYYEGNSWQDKISKNRLDKAKWLLSKRQENNQDLGLLDCIQFCDRRDLFLASQAACKQLAIEGEEQRTNLKRLLDQAEDIRNNIAHSQYEIADGASWSQVAGIVDQIESFLHESDGKIEHRAREAAEGFKDGLWTATTSGRLTIE